MIRAAVGFVVFFGGLACAGGAQENPGPHFSERFEQIKMSATKEQLFTFLYDLPKGGDLHNHFGLANMAQSWYDAATDPKRTHGNEFYTLTNFRNCADTSSPLLRFRTIQRSNYRKLSDCGKTEYGR